MKQGLIFSDIFALMAKAAMTHAAGSELTLAKADIRDSTEQTKLVPGSSSPHHFLEQQPSAFPFYFFSHLSSLTL